MADANTNPYLALLQQEDKPPSLAQILQHVANLGFGMAGGLGQAASTGGTTLGGLGSGLILGNQINAQAAQRAEQERRQRLEWQFRAQEHEDKRAEMIRKQKALEAFGSGFNVTPQQGPLMMDGVTTPQGPQPAAAPGPDLKTGGAPLVDYLVAQHNLSPLAASTIVGNLYQESSFNPSATGDSGSAFGLAQWRLDRQTGLRNFAASQPGGPKPVTDPKVQIDYLVSEMRGGDMGAQRAYAGLQQAKTPEQANAAMMHFFRPYGYTPANPTGGLHFDRRVANTRALLPQDRPSDPATAPVPTVDPYAAPAAAPGPAPRPGPGPRATPPGPGGPVTPGGSPVDPNAQPPPFVAQGGGEGEVVLPRIGLPFPAQARAPAPPGSVPFPTTSGQTAPGGPVQPNYTPTQPGMVPQAPGGAPAAGGIDAPPQRPVTPMPQPDADVVARARAGLAAGLPPGEMLGMVRQNVMDKFKQADAVVDARHAAAMEVYKQQQENKRFERGQEAQQWELMTPQQAQMKLGPSYDPAKAYQVNKKGEIKPVGGAQTVVNLDQKSEGAFAKKMGEYDAERFSSIINAEAKLNDTSAKLAYALDQFSQTYTGPLADSANQLNKILGAAGFEKAGEKANAADAAMAAISEMKPLMRAPGSGTSSDKDVDLIGKALPSLMNLPGGNARIVGYFQKLADRATEVRRLAQEHSNNGKTPLTQTGFDDAVKKLGPLFTEDERKELAELGKTKVPPPPAGFTVDKPGAASTTPPPPAGFTVK